MKGLLSNVRILDLSRMLSGPFGSMILGEHTAEILSELLGYSPEQIDKLREEGVV